MPQRVNAWNYTNRSSSTVHNDTYRGKSNGTYQASTMKSNQGFASAVATFPQGAFMTCRYPDTPAQQRKPEENNWHPTFPGVASTGTMPAVKHNTNGTKPLPIPHSQREGYEEEQRRAAEAAHEKYLAFKARQISQPGGDRIPADFHEHTVYSEVHTATEHRSGDIFRPSAVRTRRLAEEEEQQAATQRQQQLEAEYAAAAAAAYRQQPPRDYAGEDEFQPAAYDVTRDTRTNGQQPTHYNIPMRAQPHPQLKL